MANITKAESNARAHSALPSHRPTSPQHSKPARSQHSEVLYSLGDPPSLAQLRQQRSRFTPSFQLESSNSRYDSLRDKSDSISILEAEIRRLKQEGREKGEQIRDLRRILREKELEAMTKDAQSTHNLESLLQDKEEVILELTQEVERLNGGVVDKEVKRLASLYVASEKALQQAKADVEVLTERLKTLESRPQDKGLYEILGKFQGDNKRLMEEVRHLQGQVLSQTSLSTLEREFQEVEQMQNKLIMDNSRLKQELDSQQQSHHHLFTRVSEAHSLVMDCRKDLSQLTEVIRIVRKGEGVSAALILGHVSQLEHRESVEKRPEDAVMSEAKTLKADLRVLRQFLSDIYAEQSGHICTQQ
jgi:hypothetical protein